MNIRKKLLALFTVSALGLAGAGFSAAPALAVATTGGHSNSSVEQLTVGVPADIDYSCVEDDPSYTVVTLGWETPPTLPTGLSYDENAHHISGTPTQAGDFPLPFMSCSLIDAATNHVQAVVGLGAGSLVVSDITNPPPLPVTGPTILLDPLNSEACEFAMTILFPVDWDTGSMSVTFSAGDSSVTVHDKNIERLLGHWIVAPSSPQLLSEDYPDDWSTTFEKVGNNPGCGEWIPVTVNSTVGGVPIDPATSWVSPTGVDTKVEAELAAGAGMCTLYLDYELQTRVFDSGDYEGPVFVELESLNGKAKLAFVLEETDPGDEGKFEINLTDAEISFVQINGRTLSTDEFPVTMSGDFSCGSPVEANLYAATWLGGQPRSIADDFAEPLLPCGKGTWSSDSLGFQNYEVCPDAPLGSYVDIVGASAAKPCPVGMTTLSTGSTTIKDCFFPAAECGRGTYSPSGHDLPDAPCLDAPVGSYVSVKGAMVSTDCPGSMTTEAPGAASVYDCFVPAPVTIAKLKTPKAAKFGLYITLLGKTDQGTNLNINASGACSVLPVPNGVSQKFKVTMGKKAGICKLTVTAKPRGRFTGLNKTLSIKVSKTGK